MNNKEQERKANLEQKLAEIGQIESAEIVKLAKDVIPKTENDIIDFQQLQTDVNITATQTVKNIAAFYFEFDILDSHARRMVESRMNLDILSLHSIIYQIRTSDYAVSEILKQVRIGITPNSVRLFEILNGVQKTNLEATKTLSTLITLLEAQYAKLKKDIESELAIKYPEKEEENGIVRGTRSLLKDMHNLQDEITSLNENLNSSKE